MRIHVRVIRDTDDAFVARVDEYPEVIASGFTLDELREAVEDQISLFDGRSMRIDPATFSDLLIESTVTAA